jgi:cell division protein FtsB
MLRRARLSLIAAAVVAALVLVSEVPINELMQERDAAAASATELAKLHQMNSSLAAQIRGFEDGTTVERIAHERYGLVAPGQQSVVVMPGGSPGDSVGDGSSGATAPLNADTIPQSALVPSDAMLSPGSGNSSAGRGSDSPGATASLWQRFVNQLEFWKAAN